MKKKLLAAALMCLLLTGCAEAAANKGTENNSSVTVSTTSEPIEEKEETSSTTSTSSEPVEEKPVSSSITSEPEKTTSSEITSTKPVSSSAVTSSKPVSSSTATPSKPVSSSAVTSSKPVSSSTTTSSKPVSSSTTTSSKPVSSSTATPSKPVSSTSTKETAPAHNCDKDGHVWEEIYTKTEPKWHEEMHDVGDNGFDITLAERYGLCTQADPMVELTHILETPEMGAPYGLPMLLNSGDRSCSVRVWAIETYLTKKCVYCGDSIQYTSPDSFEQLGEWEFSPIVTALRNEMRHSVKLWYDMYNIPQSVLDEIAEDTKKILGM